MKPKDHARKKKSSKSRSSKSSISGGRSAGSSSNSPSQRSAAAAVSATTTVASSSSAAAASSSNNKSVSQSQSSLPSSGYLLTCDPPAKQFVRHLNETKTVDKKFILEDLDATHLLIDGRARDEILRKVEEWMDENVFSNVDRVGENLET